MVMIRCRGVFVLLIGTPVVVWASPPAWARRRVPPDIASDAGAVEGLPDSQNLSSLLNQLDQIGRQWVVTADAVARAVGQSPKLESRSGDLMSRSINGEWPVDLSKSPSPLIPEGSGIRLSLAAAVAPQAARSELLRSDDGRNAEVYGEQLLRPRKQALLIGLGVLIGVTLGVLMTFLLVQRWSRPSEPVHHQDLRAESILRGDRSDDSSFEGGADSVDSKELDSFKERVDAAMVMLRTSLRESRGSSSSPGADARARGSHEQVPAMLGAGAADISDGSASATASSSDRNTPEQQLQPD